MAKQEQKLGRGAIKTRRWNDEPEADDGLRILVCRYRPRALPKSQETWARWEKDLGPSRELHADAYGKHGPPITWEEFRKRYLAEIREGEEAQALLDELEDLVRGGQTITLLCSSACTDASACHRSLLKEILEQRVG
jgi:uncharacterized protein YeaO (DUF488 family)